MPNMTFRILHLIKHPMFSEKSANTKPVYIRRKATQDIMFLSDFLYNKNNHWETYTW